jgi:hypothetical protein
VFDRWIVLWKKVEPGTRKRAWTTKEAAKVRARLAEPDTTLEDLLAMIAWAKDGQDDYAKLLRGEPCRLNEHRPSKPHAGPDTLFKPEKFGQRKELGRAYAASVGGMPAIEGIDYLDRIIQGENHGNDAGNRRSTQEPPREGPPGLPANAGSPPNRPDGLDDGLDGANGPGAPGGHLRLVEPPVAVAGGDS